MRNSRKILYYLAGALTLLSATLTAIVFIALLYNIPEIVEVFENSILALMQDGNIDLQSVINFAKFYLFISTALNFGFAFRYFIYARYSYPQFIYNKRKIFRTVVINFFIISFIYPVLFALVATIMPESASERAEFNITFAEEKRKEYFREIIRKDQRLFAMSVKINMLKQSLQNKEITEDDYKKLLNDIITTGTSI